MREGLDDRAGIASSFDGHIFKIRIQNNVRFDRPNLPEIKMQSPILKISILFIRS